MQRPVVFLAVPHGGTISPGTFRACVGAGSDHDLYGNGIQDSEAPSLLAFGFNALWCDALNASPRPTHFAMLHSDVAPEPGWLDVLLREQRESGADIVSATVAIKDKRGCTSTGIHDPDTGRMGRITTRECEGYPKTFTADDIGYPGQCLLINTGCWVCDFSKPWVEKFAFQMRDRIARTPEGKFIPQCLSEDWYLSVWAFRMGLKVAATQAIKINHRGTFDYPNYVGWGSWEHEQEAGLIFGMERELQAFEEPELAKV